MRSILALPAALFAAALVFLAISPIAALAGSYPAPANEPVVVSTGVTYDPLTKDFVYAVDDRGTMFHCSVLDGMVVSNPVSLNGGGVFLYKDGAEYQGAISPVSEPGEYVVMINTGERNVRVLSFTIVGATTNTVHTYNMPAGMVVNEVWFNGEQTSVDYRSVSMEREGTYRVITECVASGTVYTLETTVDRTPPEIEFSGVADKQGRFGSAVTISGLNKGEKLSIARDGQPVTIEPESNGTVKLVDSGMYEIIAYDEAGNLSEHQILIMAYLNASGVAFIVLLALVLTAVIVYVLVKRRKLRIG